MFFLVAVLATAIVPLAIAKKVTQVTGAVALGLTKEQVVKTIGKPITPQKFDFYYIEGKSEIVICFDDKTGLVQAITVMGRNPKYSVRGITVGSSKNAVTKAFGSPERVFTYKKNGVESWYYPSKNVGFAMDKGRVSAFSVNEWKY